MFPLKEKDRRVVQMLLNAGCCPRCILRFCSVGIQPTYRLSCKELFTELHKFLNDDEDKSKVVEYDQPPCKKIRLQDSEKDDSDSEQNGAVKFLSSGNVLPDDEVKTCTVCLGILQDLCETDFVKKVCAEVDSAGYHFNSLVFSVSLPPQLLVREHATWLLVKQELGQQGNILKKDDILQLKEVYKWITHPLLSEELGVPVDGKSLFELSVVFAHPETDGDCHFLATACRECFRPTKNKQSIFTRMAVVKALEKIKDGDFLQQFPHQLERPKSSCVIQEIQCTHDSIYVAGRYNKFSRNLPQTPWVIGGERKMESSVEELIGEPLKKMFKVDSLNFSSSGREDVDVRALGNGRPFAIELLNPRRATFLQNELKELQQKINSSTDKIQVRDLQIVTREAIGHMKEGEEEKTKSYSALIWTEKAIVKNDIDFLQDLQDLKLDQKTPLRVLHRRPLAVRTRVIHNMRVEYIDLHHFRLYLKTQAGTYVKEFVHGDFGRTQPNLGTLLNMTTDILELDVESVDVDWPPKLDE
ncbi:putative tRNA pseudouridine synthase Pus10 isoform X2 [Hemiscyllium ocellatum]|uniref:putative tRNA pseudouridine synthase Pus10 isoform X2 n=1 Tax=Hemiscyllium ocellatum TaxID=170820 RepID=UPI0029668B1E|nr:putative tRNA pseudouridine synthase Pus10 isoform X2 [Hemiscyllium ocellatum]